MQSVLTKPAKPAGNYLRSVMLDPTTGADTFDTADDVFSWVDPGFARSRIPTTVATPTTVVSVYAVAADGTYQQLFGGNGHHDGWCLSESQVVAFCRKYRLSLCTGDAATFFPCWVGQQPVIARVTVERGLVKVSKHCFDNPGVWLASLRHQLVMRQLVE